MGKKSREKKQRQEAKKTPAKKDSQTAKKKIASQLKIDKKRLFGATLTVIMLAILAAVGYLLFQRAFRPQPIAKFLPANDTVAVLEINSNFDHNQLIKSFELLKNYPQYSKEKLIEKIENQFALNYESDLSPWLGRQIGAAVVNSQKNPEHTNLVYFAEILSKNNLKNFLLRQNTSQNNYLEYPTYMLDGLRQGQTEPRYLTIIGDYLFFSDIEQAIYEIIDYQINDADKLYYASQYRRIDDNLPLNKIAFFYINFNNIKDGFFKFFPFLSEQGFSSQSILPFFKVFDAEGVAVIATNDNFALQSFLSLDKEALENTSQFNFQEKYNAQLANYISPDITVFWGAEDLEVQLKKILALLSGGDASTLAILDGLLNSYTEKYFGPDIKFNYDILPLFAKEFAFTLEQQNGKNAYNLFMELDSVQSDSIKIHELANSFSSVGAIFKPKVVEHTLEDGTVGKEIIAIPEEIKKDEIIYLDTTVYELKIGEQDWSIYYVIFDNTALISNNLDSIKNTLDIASGKKDSLKTAKSFEQNIEPVLNSSDELAFFNLQTFLPLVFADQKLPEFVNILGSLSSGRNYFNDGIITINYLSIK